MWLRWLLFAQQTHGRTGQTHNPPLHRHDHHQNYCNQRIVFTTGCGVAVCAWVWPLIMHTKGKLLCILTHLHVTADLPCRQRGTIAIGYAWCIRSVAGEDQGSWSSAHTEPARFLPQNCSQETQTTIPRDLLSYAMRVDRTGDNDDQQRTTPVAPVG